MKLKHLFLSALVVGSLASCSKDDDGPNEPIYQQIETSLSISTTSNSGTILKSSVEVGKAEAGEASERTIKTLTAVVFYEDGTFASTKTVTDPKQDKNFNTSIDGIVVKVAATEAGQVSTTKLKVFLLANITVPTAALADYDAFIASSFNGIADYSFDEVMSGNEYLPMSSQELEVTNLLAGTAYNNRVEGSGNVAKFTSNEAGSENMVLVEKDGKYAPGDDVYSPANRISLTRYVARVQLESLEVNFGNNYEDAAFTLTSVSVANASNASLYVENAGNLQPADFYTGNDAFYRGYPADINRADYYLARSTYSQNVFSKVYGTIEKNVVNDGIKMGKDGVASVQFKDRTTNKPEENNNMMAQFYVFEFQKVATTADNGQNLPSTANSEINTMLIITGLWYNGPVKEERSFRIPIRHTAADKDFQVKRNYIYKVHATLTGEGTNNPDKSMLNACLSFSIDVQPWQVIKQVEDDVN